MSLDNSLTISSFPQAHPSLQCSRGRTISYPTVDTSPSGLHPKQMNSFTPRPFPPPALAHVPVEYIFDQLRFLAPNFWNRPETADCTIIVPVPYQRGRSMRALETPSFPTETLPSVASRHDPAGLGRRVTEPTTHSTPRMSLNLHMDYLCAKSTFLRGIFSGASPLDLINTTSNGHPQSGTPPTRFTVPANRLPRLLPSSLNHPILFLPVPDPSSLHLLIHWMYFGRKDFIEDCLNRGLIQWEGIARNVEYLGFPIELKVFLGRWYCDAMRSKQTVSSRNGASLSSRKGKGTTAPVGNDNDMDVDTDINMSSCTDQDMECDDELSLRGRKATVGRRRSHR